MSSLASAAAAPSLRLAAALAILAACSLAAPARAQIPEDFVEQRVAWQQRDRLYHLHIPPTSASAATASAATASAATVSAATASAGRPLIVALHGAGSNSREFGAMIDLTGAADRAGMVLALPDGSGDDPEKLTWNAGFCCGFARREQIDDVGFMDALLDDIARRTAIDPQRVFAIGFSNGGMLAHRLAAERPRRYAAIIAVAGAIGGTAGVNAPLFRLEPPIEPVAIGIVHGAQDPFILYQGGISPVLHIPGRENLSVAAAVAFWRKADDCKPASETAYAAGIAFERWAACRSGGEVARWVIEGAGHVWPSQLVSSTAPHRLISSADAIVAFLGRHARPAHSVGQ